jgi:putative methionine-R-sulfoxide reductase with GAF domain
MEQYDKYKTTHSSITFGEDDEQQRLEESDEQRAERYAKHQLQWQKYLTESKNLLKNVAGNMALYPRAIRNSWIWLHY